MPTTHHRIHSSSSYFLAGKTGEDSSEESSSNEEDVGATMMENEPRNDESAINVDRNKLTENRKDPWHVGGITTTGKDQAEHLQSQTIDLVEDIIEGEILNDDERKANVSYKLWRSGDQEIVEIIDDDEDKEKGKENSKTEEDGNDKEGKKEEEKPPTFVDSNDTETTQDPPVQKPINPFAKFAFDSNAPSSHSSFSRWVSTAGVVKSNQKKRIEKPANGSDTQEKTKKMRQNKKSKAKCDEFIPMKDLPKDEQERIRKKWHSLADASKPIEVQRFHIMVASRLHARCQEPVVRKCMEKLREAGVLTPKVMAALEPEVLSSRMKSLQYYNTKAQHLVKASNQLLQNFKGEVPESRSDLLSLTGIGPVMADLLSVINTRESFQR